MANPVPVKVIPEVVLVQLFVSYNFGPTYLDGERYVSADKCGELDIVFDGEACDDTPCDLDFEGKEARRVYRALKDLPQLRTGIVNVVGFSSVNVMHSATTQ